MKSMLSVDTKVAGHGWRRRNFRNNGLHSSPSSADCLPAPKETGWRLTSTTVRAAEESAVKKVFSFAYSSHLDPKTVGKVGLRLNSDKTVILTNEAQPPNTLVTREGLILKVLDRNQGQKMARMHIACLWK